LHLTIPRLQTLSLPLLLITNLFLYHSLSMHQLHSHLTSLVDPLRDQDLAVGLAREKRKGIEKRVHLLPGVGVGVGVENGKKSWTEERDLDHRLLGRVQEEE
jgi:hypothetical protein